MLTLLSKYDKLVIDNEILYLVDLDPLEFNRKRFILPIDALDSTIASIQYAIRRSFGG